MKNTKQSGDSLITAAVLPVAGMIVGAAVMATVSNHKNQEKAQVLVDKVKKNASAYMKSAKDAIEEGKEKSSDQVAEAVDSSKKVATNLKKDVRNRL